MRRTNRKSHGRHGRVFISYRRDDGAGHARLIYERLRRHLGRRNLFIDVDAIPAGTDFGQLIDETINRSDVLLALIGQRWLTETTPAGRRIDEPDDYVRMEIGTALKHNITVIPVLIQGALMPSVDQVPSDLAELPRRNAVTLTDGPAWDDDVDRLTREVQRITARHRLFKRHHVLAGVLLAVMFSVVAVLSAIRSPGATGLPVPKFPEGTNLERIQRRGYVVVGVKADSPGFAVQDKALSRSFWSTGFEPRIAALLATAIFGGTPEQAGKDRVHWKSLIADERENLVTTGAVDMVVASYTITPDRQRKMDFAGPYLLAHQDIMVRSDSTGIWAAPEGLAGRRVCVTRGSTSLDNLQALAPMAEPVLDESSYKCALQLKDRKVDAVTNDDLTLAALVETSGGEFKRIGARISTEPYGIALAKGEWRFCELLNQRLGQIYKREWRHAFKTHLTPLGILSQDPPQPSPCLRPSFLTEPKLY